MNIRKFTDAATRVINIREGDINCPLTDFSHNLECPPQQEVCYDLVELLQQALSDHQPKEQEMLLRPSENHLVLRINPYWSEKRECQGLVLSFIDIHQIKQAEENLRRRSEQLRLITDAMPAWIAYIDDQCRYRFSNRAYENWFGRPSAEIEGSDLSSVLGDEVYQQVLPYVDTALSGKDVTFDLELSFFDKDSRWVSVSYIPHILESGRVKGFFALISDISDRLADVMMPDLDGIETLRRLQTNAKTQEIPVIFLTAKALTKEQQQLKNLGTQGLIAKPFDAMTLGEQISILLHW